MSPEQSLSLLKSESRVRIGPVPEGIAGRPVLPGHSRLIGDEYLLRPDETLGFHYARGQGITVERLEGADPVQEHLWLNGSVYAAMAAINGFLPIHASAVAHEGGAIAFTGRTGAGKSTLIAALGQRGFPMFCDDTLVLDISAPDAITAMPGHKRLKLTPEAIALTAAEREEPVGAGTGKFYARPAAGDWQTPLPFTALIFLEESSDVSIRHIAGAERFARLQDDHYTATLFALAGALSPEDHFRLRARLAQSIPMLVFSRPRDGTTFAEGVDCMARALGEGLVRTASAR